MWGTNSLNDPSLAVPYEGKGLDPNDRKVNINARDGTIIADKIIVGDTIIVRNTIKCANVSDLNGNAIVTNLNGASFSTGTYRISQGGTYRLSENIVFNAPTGAASTRSDLPLSGAWFAAISIETSATVIIDGAGFTMSLNSDYLTKNIFGTFAMVLLGNGQFAGSLFAATPVKYPDAAVHIPSYNVIIMNLHIIGVGSHFGVMMNNNNNCKLINCTIEDCQVANIFGQSPQGLDLVNTKLMGSVTPIRVTMDMTQLASMRGIYTNLIAGGVPGAQAQYALLEAFVLANPTRFDPTLVTPQAFPSSHFSLFITPGPTAQFPFPTSLLFASVAASLADGFRNGLYGANITIDNCEIKNSSTLFEELVFIGSNIPLAPLFPLTTWPLIFFGMFGGLQWKDAYAAGVFAPNEYLRSIVFIMDYLWNLPAALPFPILPANSQNIFTAILTKPVTPASTLLFNSNAAPNMSNQNDGTPAKGHFAARITAATNVSIRNLIIDNINSTQTILPVDQTTLPGFGSLTAPQAPHRSQGNDTWAVSLEACKNVTIEGYKITNILSTRGYTFGVDMEEDSDGISVNNGSIVTMSSPNTLTNAATDAGDVFGFPADRNIGPISLKNCTTKGLIAGGVAEPFFDASAGATTVNGNQNLLNTPFTLTVASTVGFPADGMISVVTTDVISARAVQYSGITATTFTGCIATGAAAPVPTLNGAAVTSAGRSQINCFTY